MNDDLLYSVMLYGHNQALHFFDCVSQQFHFDFDRLFNFGIIYFMWTLVGKIENRLTDGALKRILMFITWIDMSSPIEVVCRILVARCIVSKLASTLISSAVTLISTSTITFRLIFVLMLI